MLAVFAQACFSLVFSLGASKSPLSGQRLAHVRMGGKPTCAWATDAYASRQTTPSSTPAWVNEKDLYLQTTRSRGADELAPNPSEKRAGAAVPAEATCGWATDAYATRQASEPSKTPAWVNEKDLYLQTTRKPAGGGGAAVVSETCAWATEAYATRQASEPSTTPAWVNEKDLYLQTTRKPVAGGAATPPATPKRAGAAGPAEATCGWATDAYATRQAAAPPKTPAWVNESDLYLQTTRKRPRYG